MAEKDWTVATNHNKHRCYDPGNLVRWRLRDSSDEWTYALIGNMNPEGGTCHCCAPDFVYDMTEEEREYDIQFCPILTLEDFLVTSELDWSTFSTDAQLYREEED